MVPRTSLSALLALVAVVALAGCSGGSWEDDCVTKNGVIECAVGKRAPAPKVAGELLDGARYDIAQDRGQVVVVNFWGSWCAPCVAEADDLEATYQATKSQGVRFLGVNINDGRDKAKAFEQGRVGYPSLFDPGSRVALDFQVPPNSVPATIVLDRDGRIAVVIRQAVRQEGLQPIVARVAAEKPAPDGSR
jgi:thiol-disulfide isomerase/thioredoxin